MSTATDVRLASEIGRTARLDLVFGVRDGRTVLEEAYAEPPMRVGRCFPGDSGTHLILASSAPGIFGGDSFEQNVHIRAGATVRLSSQSALQVHPSMTGAPASIRSRFKVEAGGELQCVWHPVVPFSGSSLDQQIRIDVARDGRLFWSDAMTAGREGRGERWRFARYHHQLKVTRDERLVYLERHRLGDRGQGDRAWAAGNAVYFGSVLRLGYGDDVKTAESHHQALSDRDGVYASADLLEPGVMLVRLAGQNGVAFHAARDAQNL